MRNRTTWLSSQLNPSDIVKEETVELDTRDVANAMDPSETEGLSDDEPFLEELKEELDQTTLWRSSFATQLEEAPRENLPAVSQSYASRIA